MFGFKKDEKEEVGKNIGCPENRTTCCRKCLECENKVIEKEGMYTIIKCKLSTSDFIVAPFRDVM